MKLFAVKSKKNRGFTLIEVLLVIILLVTILLPLIQVVSSALVASGEAKSTNMALKIAQIKLEQIRNTVYNNISSEAKASIPASPSYSRQVIVTEPGNGLKNIRVIVYWFAGEGSEISIEVGSMVTEHEE